MATFSRMIIFSRSWLQNKNVLTANAVRTMGYWNKDWKPGPFPETPEERERAAKKYGLRVEDYEAYKDDGFGYGDYPKLPVIPSDARDPNENYDHPAIRRNYGEPVHVDADAYSEDRWNPKTPYVYSFYEMGKWLFLVSGSIIASYIFMEKYPHYHPALAKQYPYKGDTHYLFVKSDTPPVIEEAGEGEGGEGEAAEGGGEE